MLTMLRSSEFWLGLVVVIVSYLSTVGFLPQSVMGVDVAQFIIAGVTYVLGRLFGKAAKALVKG